MSSAEPDPQREPDSQSPEPEASAAPESQPDEPEASAQAPVCDLCGAPMIERHCRLVCVQCGYQRDCSDP